MNEVFVSIHLEELTEGGFLATSNDLPGLVAQGRTVTETLEIAQDVARKLVESYKKHGDELPTALRVTPDRTTVPVNPGDLPEGTDQAIIALHKNSALSP